MPYIDPIRRPSAGWPDFAPENAGELNYTITQMCNYYLSHAPVCYQRINDIIGALEGAKLEFYRRVVAPYEDKKKEENGDVYL